MNYPVSIKGIIFINDKIVLLKNEREEWELPGGRIEIGESPEDCVIREIQEELGINCQVDRIIDSWMYNVVEKYVFITTYLCKKISIAPNIITISSEHKEVRLFTPSEIDDLPMPQGYKNSIRKALQL